MKPLHLILSLITFSFPIFGLSDQIPSQKHQEQVERFSVEEFRACLDMKFIGKYEFSCIPSIKPDSCSQILWNKLLMTDLEVSINVFRRCLRKLGFLPVPDCLRKDTKEYAEAKSDHFFSSLSLPYINAENALWRKWRI